MIFKTRYLFPALETFGIITILNLDQQNSKFTASQLFKELNEIRNWLKHTMLHSNCIEQHYVEQSTLNSRPFHWADTVILGIGNTVSESQKFNLLKLSTMDENNSEFCAKEVNLILSWPLKDVPKYQFLTQLRLKTFLI